MPQLIRTPEQIFREEGRDIYYVRFQSGNSKDCFSSDHEEIPGRKEILEWLKQYVPNSRVECLAPSEYSGWLIGYFGDLRVDFSEADLTVFCTRWENQDGKSVDPRFQCFLWPFGQWLEKVSKYPPTDNRPDEPGLAIWWDTPMGVIFHQISIEEATRQNLARHPGNERDIWYSATICWPELDALHFDQVTCGHVFKNDDGALTMYYTPCWTGCKQVDFPIERQQEISSWLRLPAETKVLESGY